MADERKKVLFLLPSLTGGGAERVFTTLLRHLDRTRFEPHLALLQARARTWETFQRCSHSRPKVSRVRYALPKIVKAHLEHAPSDYTRDHGTSKHCADFRQALLSARYQPFVREAVIPSALFREENKNVRYGDGFIALFTNARTKSCAFRIPWWPIWCRISKFRGISWSAFITL